MFIAKAGLFGGWKASFIKKCCLYKKCEKCKECNSSNFQDDYWKKTLKLNPIIINGKCYIIGNEVGFSGKIFAIAFLDNRPTVKTNRLCYKGKVPKKYKVSDNAVFLYSLM